ncbi:MAG: glycosyltransferase [Rhodospirillales bacterium]
MRAATIARNMCDAGLEVTVVLGGLKVLVADFGPADIIHLPPVRSDGSNFKVLLDENDVEIDDDFKNRRRDELLNVYASLNPNVLLVELFPFGRRQLRFELMPLLAAARESSKIVCSVRDVLVPMKKPKRIDEIIDTALAHFDQILVHGDKSVIPFTETFPRAAELHHLMSYTGYVVDHNGLPDIDTGTGEVIVSVGGGAVGEILLRTSIAARGLSAAEDRPWRLLAGRHLPKSVFDDLKAAAGAGITVEWARNDFRALLRNADLSISQGGYNTTMDVLQAGCRNVIVPMAEADESEQTLRAGKMEAKGLVHMVRASNLSPENLATAVNKALAAPPPPILSGINLGGAQQTARIVAEI